MVRTKLAAISDADADIHSPPPARAILPVEMMGTPPAPISADAIKDNLGLDNEQIAALGNDKAPAAKAAAAKTAPPKPATAKPEAVKGATAMPAVPVPVIKADNIPNAAKTSGNKTAEGLLPMKWQHIFSNLAVGPKAMTVNGTKLNMTAPLQHAWTINDFKIGLNLGQPLNTDGLDQSAKHYMFNMRRACQGEFVAEADEQKVTTNGMIRWQIAETVCAGKKGEVLTALLFTTSSDESVIIAIEGKMQDAPRLIRLRNDVLQMMSR